MARLGCADLFLDTFPCNAHTVASDALWAGLPLLTLAGETFASRVAASLLHAVGLEELISGSLPEYEALAIRLGRDRQALSSLRGKLERSRGTASLFDTRTFVRHLESLYRSMWARHVDGSAAAPLP